MPVMTRPRPPRLSEDAAAPLRAAMRVEQVARREQKAAARAAAAEIGLSIRAVAERARRARARQVRQHP